MPAALQNIDVQCPSCWEKNTYSVDFDSASQEFIEDCMVCCHPINIRTTIADGEIVEVLAEPG